MKFFPFALLSLVSAAQGQVCPDIIELPILPGFENGSGEGISCAGDVVAGTSYNHGNTEIGAYRWSEAQGILPLGALGGTRSYASDISCDGEVIVGYANTAAQQAHPFRWTETGGMEDLLLLSGIAGTGVANAVSEDGAVIVGYYRASGERAFLWRSSTGVQDLPALSSFGSRATDVSHDGRFAVGWSKNASLKRRAVRWSPMGGIEDLGTLGGETSEAYAVSSDGQVIVGLSTDALGLVLPFRWTSATGMVVLDPSIGPFSKPRAVNRDGTVVVGQDQWATHQAFQWTLDDGAGEPLLRDSLSAIDVTPDGSTVLALAVSSTTSGINSYAPFLIRTNPVGSKYCAAATPNSTGCNGYISAAGSALLSSNALTLSAARLPRNTFGFFLTSQATSTPSTVPGSQGVLCLGGAIGRFVGPGQVQASGPAGRFDLTVDLMGLPTPTGPVTAMVGDTWSFQCWHRDANPGLTSNLTDAVSVVMR